jgi:carboxyl-terminal processing protease
MKASNLRIFILIVISLLIGYFVGVTKINLQWKQYVPQINASSKEPPPSVTNVDFAQMWVVMDKLQKEYYDKSAIDSQKLLNGAISGMVASLGDPYTVYLPPQQNQSFKDGLAGKFEGIGAELGTQGSAIVVVKPLYGSPAQKAGIRIGDTILKVNDDSTQGMTVSDAVQKIRGPKGSAIELTVLHLDDDRPTAIKIVRDEITVKSVEGWIKPVKQIKEVKLPNVEGEVMYLRLSQFGDNTNQEWLTLINTLDIERKNKNIKGVILDLRYNPGGYLTDAVFIASEFISTGKTVVIQDDGRGEQRKMDVSRQGLLLDVPVVVLVNKGSASASEIVAGALRDHKRATLVGETSFGKGTIQQAEDLGGGAGIHVTIAKWLTPDQIWVHKKGLEPEIKVAVDNKNPSHDVQLEKAIQELLK